MTNRDSETLRIQAEMVFAGVDLNASPREYLRWMLSDPDTRLRFLSQGKDPDEIWRSVGGDPDDLKPDLAL